VRRPFAFASRRFLVWLLACLVPLQAMAAGVIAAAGPSHHHVPVTAARLVLDDFRRAPIRLMAVEAHVATAFGHFHGGASPERHHHAAGDATVMLDGGDLPQAGDGDGISVSPSLGVFVGLISAPPGWQATALRARPASYPGWTPQTHHPDLLERPPRAG